MTVSINDTQLNSIISILECHHAACSAVIIIMLSVVAPIGVVMPFHVLTLNTLAELVSYLTNKAVLYLATKKIPG